jgi:hypothetical protein
MRARHGTSHPKTKAHFFSRLVHITSRHHPPNDHSPPTITHHHHHTSIKVTASIIASVWASADEIDLVCCALPASFLAATLLALSILCWRDQQNDDDDYEFDQLFDDASDYAVFFFCSLALALSFFAGLITYLTHGDAISAWAATHYNEQVPVVGIVLLSVLLVAFLSAEIAGFCFRGYLMAPFALALSVFAGLIAYLAYGEAISAWAATLSSEQVFVVVDSVPFIILLAYALAKEKELSVEKQLVKIAELNIEVLEAENKVLAKRVENEGEKVLVAELRTADLQSKHNTLRNDFAAEHETKILTEEHNTNVLNLCKNMSSELGERDETIKQLGTTILEKTTQIEQLGTSLQDLLDENDRRTEQLKSSHKQDIRDKDGKFNKVDVDHQRSMSQNKNLTALLKISRGEIKKLRGNHKQNIRKKDGQFKKLDGNYQRSISQNKDLSEELERSREEIQRLKSDYQRSQEDIKNLKSNHEHCIREKDEEYQTLDASYRHERSKITELEKASLAKDSEMETQNDEYQKLETAKNDLEKTSRDLEKLYHSEQSSSFSKGSEITDLKRQCQDLRDQNDDFDKQWTRKLGELQEEYRTQGEGHGDLIRRIESLTQQGIDQEKYWTEKCGRLTQSLTQQRNDREAYWTNKWAELEQCWTEECAELVKQHQDDQDASLAKDFEIAALKLERDIQDERWINQHQAHETARSASDTKLRWTEKELQDTKGNLRNVSISYNMSVSHAQRLEGDLNCSRRENEELTTKLNSSRQEIEDLTSSHQDSIAEKDEEISDMKIHQAEALDEKDHLHRKLLKDKAEELKSRLQDNIPENSVSENENENQGLVETLTSRLQDIVAEKNEEISDVKIQQGEILDRKDHQNMRCLDDMRDEHNEVYDGFMGLMAKRNATIAELLEEIATLKGIVRPHSMAPEKEGTKETRLTDALTHPWDITDLAEAQLNEVEEEDGKQETAEQETEE